MKPPRRSEKKVQKPDEVFEAPGMRMERRGRFVDLRTHRTPEEHKRLIKHLVDSRPRLLEDIQKATEELQDLLHRFNSLELLAQVWFNNSVGDPNEYKEYSFEGRPPYVEHLAVLELKDTEYKLRTMEMPGGPEIEKAQQLLDTIFTRTLFYYGTETLDRGQSSSISRIAQLRFDTIMDELMVRSPTYYSHHADVLRALFGKPPAQEWMQSVLRFDIEKALKLVQAISDLMMARLLERRERALAFAGELSGYTNGFRRTGKFSGPEELRNVVNRIRNMRGKEAKKTIKSIAVSWAFYELHETVAFTAAELARNSDVDLAAVESFLNSFSLRFGSTPSDYLLPQPTSPLKVRPIIRFGERYFCPAAHLLIWAIKPQLERLLKPGTAEAANHDAKLWERYQKHRSNLLIQRGVSYFQELLIRGRAYQNLRYRTVENGVEKIAELDGLVLFDRYAFLIEAKAGEFSPSARRGGKLRMVRDLKELVEEPHRQALRASAYISSNHRPVFELEDGSVLSFEKKDYKQFFMVTLTLENLDVFTREIYHLREIGIFETEELPWAVSLDDMRIIAETIRLPTQFTHYLKWRLHLNQVGRIVAQSELDWLGYYLAEGPKLLTVPEGYDFMMLQTYTTGFDDFYLYEQGERTVPAPRPSQFCPREVTAVLASIEERNGSGYTSVGEAVLGLGFEERKRLGRQIQEIYNAGGRRHPIGLEVIGHETAVVLKIAGKEKEPWDALAESLARTRGRTTAVLALDSAKLGSVTGWGVCEVARDKP